MVLRLGFAYFTVSGSVINYSVSGLDLLVLRFVWITPLRASAWVYSLQGTGSVYSFQGLGLLLLSFGVGFRGPPFFLFWDLSLGFVLLGFRFSFVRVLVWEHSFLGFGRGLLLLGFRGLFTA